MRGAIKILCWAAGAVLVTASACERPDPAGARGGLGTLKGHEEPPHAAPVAPVEIDAGLPADPEEDDLARDETLSTEAPEENPESKTVKLKLEVSPRHARPLVYWGREKLGEPPLVIERPRRSGPMDIVIKADGYLEYHTRLFTDRDDRLSVVLVRPTETQEMLGFKRRPDAGTGPLGDGGTGPRRGAPFPSADAGASGFVVPEGVSF
ncbi:MAG: hypothetical protein KA712_23285 [Myxococcales bacterium]|nr:hypothetical protein [Myxococcales bacterium]